MRLIGNILWFLFGGAVMGLAWTLAGVLWSLTIIGIPVGRQCFKIAGLCFFPFGKRVVSAGGSTVSFLLNLVWLCLTGLPLAAAAAGMGVVCCVTVIGIPFGRQYFKLARLALMPFGAAVL